MKTTNKTLLIAGALTASLVSGAALADYPERPINVIVPWGAGGDSDLTTRIWADAVEKELGVPVVVINKPGGGGVVGTAFVANSKKDGYTLINAGLGNMLVTPNFSKAPYSFDSFDPVIKMTAVPLAVVVAKDSPYKTFDDFIAGAKSETLTQGAWGASSSGTILADIIADQAGYKVKYVHAKGAAASMVSVVGGHIDSAVSFPPAFGPHVKADRARALVMNQKMDAFPNVPTFADYGIQGSFEGWSGVFAPKGVPSEVVEKLAAATTKIMQDPEVIKKYQNIGAVVDFRQGPEWIADMKVTYSIMKDAAAKKANQ
ncbi:Bug family tripartite tricarboxylate transporter substrate binding protein [Amphritea balenae]|uniref:Tripartite tricarboxylate transporter substrate binding protein n=1 Tax=Amphritea balenae TaxID=452629 RepID=A0A3P1SRW6_9GAMM|nr:tripartite tricarboxylate transporter substrate binding protein [Amphritea balenae]RRC99385.1 tripartite tricarboxylate transporter substrate binding protein [Amphritea balenae]GGK71560.1 C4-dicarboxylate ABC transporter substrate-binding protein [Amphritea balenae]